MAVIGYLTRTHFAEAAIEDALPEDFGNASSALVLIDEAPGGRAALARVEDALPHTALSISKLTPLTSLRDALGRTKSSLEDIQSRTLIAVGGALAIGQARLAAELMARGGVKLTVIAVPVGLFDLGLARQVRPAEGRPVTCPRPDLIVADPTVLLDAPIRHISASAMETMVNAIEAYASPSYNPPADGLALQAVRQITRWLPVVMDRPRHAEALRELMAAAMTAGLSLEKSIGGIDALARPITAELGPDILPGNLHAPLMAAMADFNAEAVGDRYIAMARTFARESYDPRIADEIGTFARALGMPTSLREIGVNPARFDRFAEMAANDPAALANPRRLTPQDCRRILEAAW